MTRPWGIIGNSAAIAPVRQAIAGGHVRHSWLIAGPPSVGKRTLADSIAASLLCQAPRPDGDPCHDCLACRKLARGVHPDVQVFSLQTQLEAAGSRAGANTSLNVETVRAICSAAGLRPMEGRWKIVIVEDAGTMQDVAQEALLKTLEDPPPFLLLLLLATDSQVLMPTVRSRCQVVELLPVPATVLADGLVDRGIEPGPSAELALLAGGAPGWAIRASQQPALAGERRAAVDSALGWVTASPWERMAGAFRRGDAFSKRRDETFIDLEQVLAVWRDVALLAVGADDAVPAGDRRDRLAGWARQIPAGDAILALRSVQGCIRDLESNVRPKLALEMMVMTWPNP